MDDRPKFDIAATQTLTQEAIDDASEDHLYVGTWDWGAVEKTCLMANLCGDTEKDRPRIEALQFTVVGRAKMWRVNGGVGRVMAFWRSDGKSIEVRLRVAKSAGHIFNLIREHEDWAGAVETV